MSQANIELVRRVFENPTGEENDEIEIRSIFHPEVEFLPQRAGTEGVYRGIAGIEKFRADTEQVFEKFAVHYELLDLGGRILAWGKVDVRPRGSGIEVDVPIGCVFGFRDGKIVRWEDFGSKEKALEALGLRDSEQKNIEVVLASIDAYNAEDLDAQMATYAPEAVVEVDAMLDVAGGADHIVGRELLRTRVEANLQDFWSGRYKASDVRAVGKHRVLSRGEWGGVGSASGIELYVDLSVLFTLRDGLITRAEFYADRDAALKAAGMEPDD
jgi:ketosteroid isomerase-like protein